jgi:plastocyanin
MVGWAVLAATGFLLSACGGSSTTSSNPGSSSNAATPSSTPLPGTAVVVTEKEFAIEMAETAFAAGTYSFKVSNQGKFPHNLTIEGPGVDQQASPTIESGASGVVTVTLQAGSYEFWCGVDGHKDKGMKGKFTVS